MRFVIHPEYSNLTPFLHNLPNEFSHSGEVLYKVRNEVRLIEQDGLKLVVKKFKVPHFLNRIAYTFFRKSKARRSYEHSLLLIDSGFEAAKPIAYSEYYKCGLISDSYYISLFSSFDRDFNEFRCSHIDGRESVLKEFARFTARMHDKGILHLDYGGGNILFREHESVVEFCLLDVNRMKRGQVDLKSGVENFKLLYMFRDSFHYLIEEYAKQRGFDLNACLEIIDPYIEEEKI